MADTFLDAFDAAGRYLGEVKAPPTAFMTLEVFIRDDVFVVPAVDEVGTVTVKQYRLVLPRSQ